VNIDGTDYVLPLAEPVDVRAQTLTLASTLGEKKYEARATAAIGRVTVIEMTSPDEPRNPAPVTAPVIPADAGATPAPPAPARSFWDIGRITGVALFGVGVVGVGAGVLFGASSNSAADRANGLQAQLGRDGCGGASPPKDCDDLRSARDDQDRRSTLSTGFVIGGAVFAAAGAVFFLWPRSDVHVTPSAGAQGASLLMTGSF
jgi:hypothetical protein